VGALAAATISTEIRDDEGHAFINRLSERYVWAPYLRPGPREIFVITPGRVRAFMGPRLSCHGVRE
jgi:hypothetical protein